MRRIRPAPARCHYRAAFVTAARDAGRSDQTGRAPCPAPRSPRKTEHPAPAPRWRHRGPRWCGRVCGTGAESLILHVNNDRRPPTGCGLQLNRLRGTSSRNRVQGRKVPRMGFNSDVRPFAVAAALALGLMLGGCFTQTYQRGYVLAEGALEQIPLGAPQEQVLISLGTPSTVATVSGEVFYYISARTEQTSFLPEKVVDQRVVAVYFDKNRRVQRIANYGQQDGKIFDYISRTTPTSGQELSYLTYVFKIFGGK